MRFISISQSAKTVKRKLAKKEKKLNKEGLSVPKGATFQLYGYLRVS